MREAGPAASVIAARSPRVVAWFGRYIGWYLARNFHGVRLLGPAPSLPADRPAIIYSNHPSWWDPALFVLLATRLFPDRVGYGPMEAAALEQYRFMRRLGIFGIEPGTGHGAMRFLQVSSGLLAEPRTMLWITAEGHFTDARQRPVRLQPGIAHLAARTPRLVLVPLALEYPFWNERYPEALARFGEPIEASSPGGRSVPDWTALLEDRLTGCMDRLAQAAMTRDARLFEPLVAGSVGVGGVYDSWRRLKAAVRGRRFRPGHEGQAVSPEP